MFLIASSKKGISSNQLHRTLGVTLKSAWFLSHRIREAMKETGGAPFGGNYGGVEADETLQGQDPRKHNHEYKAGGWHLNRVLTLIDRDTGRARSFGIHIWRLRTTSSTPTEASVRCSMAG